jgi:UDP-3-O-[3-hydroxymyristoyl] N-acetylglucosamine deacetylase/3-hydroxyacyl-[acyl-carrier-protein] dehydratase
LHSGNKVTMTFHPAEPDSGIRFRRIDLDGKPEVFASVENVSDTNRSTTLSKGNVKIHTVEHILATFSGYGVTNAIVDLEANEPPIADGSSREYCRMVKEVGAVDQDAVCEPYAVTEPIHFQLGETIMSIFPHDGLRITCTSADRTGRYTQHFSVDVDEASWEKELSEARTFCFLEELEYLYNNGLIRGGSLENAVIIRDDAILTNEPMRYSNEFVRHKMLDIVGDLSLAGRRLKGHVVAIRPSHAANCQLARELRKQIDKPTVAAQAFAPPPEKKNEQAKKPNKAVPKTEVDSEKKTEDTVPAVATMDVTEVMKLLPHRYPFLMVDRVTKIEGNRIVAVKNVTVNEPFFQGHFPGHPIMPGVLQLEAIAQVAGILTLQKAGSLGKIAYFMSAEKVKWRKPVTPGDVLVIDVELTRARGKVNRAKGVCYVDGVAVSEAEVTFALMDP